MACIYKIEHKLSGKKYIGQTSTTLYDRLNREFHGHFADAFIFKKHDRLYRAMRKYGKDAFTYEVLEEITEYQTKEELHRILDDRERYWISYYDTCKTGYNYNPGGNGSGKHLSEAHKKKISCSNKGKKRSLEVRKKMSNARKGVKWTEERKRKVAETKRRNGTNAPWNKGLVGVIKQTPEQCQAKSIRQKGHKFSEEHNRKVSESLKEYNRTKKELGLNYHTDEEKRKISDSLKRAYQEGRRKRCITKNQITLTYKNETKPLTAWAKLFNLKSSTLYSRIRSGFSVEDALTLPVRKGVHYKNLKK